MNSYANQKDIGGLATIQKVIPKNINLTSSIPKQIATNQKHINVTGSIPKHDAINPKIKVHNLTSNN